MDDALCFIMLFFVYILDDLTLFTKKRSNAGVYQPKSVP